MTFSADDAANRPRRVERYEDNAPRPSNGDDTGCHLPYRSMELAIGDVVVYGAHGAGSVTAREFRDVRGEQQVVIVLALAHGLSVALPLARAEELLRPVADAEEIARLRVI